VPRSARATDAAHGGGAGSASNGAAGAAGNGAAGSGASNGDASAGGCGASTGDAGAGDAGAGGAGAGSAVSVSDSGPSSGDAGTAGTTGPTGITGIAAAGTAGTPAPPAAMLAKGLNAGAAPAAATAEAAAATSAGAGTAGARPAAGARNGLSAGSFARHAAAAHSLRWPAFHAMAWHWRSQYRAFRHRAHCAGAGLRPQTAHGDARQPDVEWSRKQYAEQKVAPQVSQGFGAAMDVRQAGHSCSGRGAERRSGRPTRSVENMAIRKCAALLCAEHCRRLNDAALAERLQTNRRRSS
jgi:hypothetical protein